MPVSRELWQGRVFSAYLRNTAKAIDGQMYHALVIAKVELTPELQGKGYFRQLCTFVEEFAASHPFVQVVVHECVLNPELAAMHQRHGYIEVPQSEGSPASDFYKWAKRLPISLSAQLRSMETSS